MADGRNYGGRYEVIERAGVGGMAEVYRARDELLGREVAVKVLSENLSRDRSFVERFRREAQSAANLNHPNIASIYDYGADNGTYFIVMEFIDGSSLSDIIDAEGPLMPERAAEIASDVAQALERAHSTGLVHRDIKPANIMMSSNGQTKVTDFGIARAVRSDGEATMTQTGMVIGTASYLAPEQAQGNPVDARTDVYALGCVLYEMLVGHPPFTGDSPLAIAYKHVRETPEAPSALNPDVPSALDAITLKALAKNPDNRYADAAEMRADLGRFLAGHAVHATPLLADETMVAAPATGTQVLHETDIYPEEEEPAPPPPKRRTGWYVLLTLLILALLGLVAWLLAERLLGAGVQVPDVVGQNVRDATASLEEAGLEADVKRRANDSPRGQVYDQDPPAGEEVDEGSAVSLFVSSGPAQTEVPDVSGMTERQARAAIEDADLSVSDVVSETSADVEEGRVIRTDPAAGTTVNTDSGVTLFVSSGPEVVEVPSVIGMSEDEARDALSSAGLVPEVAHEASDEDEGIVFAQDPEAGTDATAGDVVSITVSSGPEEQEMPDVIGQEADAAEEQLENDFGLKVKQEEADEGCAETSGVVCEQDPAPGTPVAEGDEATLLVSPDSDE